MEHDFIKTVDFAARKHRDQRRKDPESTPYINHPIGVAMLLVEHKVNDRKVIMAALLHDTVEDTDTTYDELVKEFGREIADIVMEVTDDKSLHKAARKLFQILNASKKTQEAKLVKLTD